MLDVYASLPSADGVCHCKFYTLLKLYNFIIHMPKWRNGRRKRLKISRGQLHVGSTPTFGTILERTFILKFFFYVTNKVTIFTTKTSININALFSFKLFYQIFDIAIISNFFFQKKKTLFYQFYFLIRPYFADV